VRRELGRFGPAFDLGDLLERWPDAVGEGIARNAWPARVGRDGTVHVNTADSVWAFELAHRAAEIAERLGVEAVKFAPGPLPGTDEKVVSEPVPHPTEEQQREAARIVAGIAEPNLRESIQKAVSLGLARGPRDRPL
jgi:hypothetical protein